jgi:hypothetical protein
MYEIALSAISYVDHSAHERAREGDIIAVRKQGLSEGIGRRSQKTVIWVLMELDVDFADKLLMPLSDPLDPEDSDFIDGTVKFYEKRRYNMPLERLERFCPWIVLSDVRDEDKVYQPFLPVATDDNYYLQIDRSYFPTEGLIFDKGLGIYL